MAQLNQNYTAKSNHVKKAAYELEVKIGDSIKILEIYDDKPDLLYGRIGDREGLFDKNCIFEENGNTQSEYTPTDYENYQPPNVVSSKGSESPNHSSVYLNNLEPNQKSKIATAMFAYKKRQNNKSHEIDLVKGRTYTIISQSKYHGWITVKDPITNNIGDVPRNHLDKIIDSVHKELLDDLNKPKSFYIGQIDRENANCILRDDQDKLDGDFLIRDCNNKNPEYGPYQYVLTVKHTQARDSSGVQNFLIYVDDNGRWNTGNSKHSSLEALIDHYSVNEVKAGLVLRPLELGNEKGSYVGSARSLPITTRINRLRSGR